MVFAEKCFPGTLDRKKKLKNLEFGHNLLHCPHALSLTAQENEDFGRPRTRPRRYSDSNLYCKARDEDIRENNQRALLATTVFYLKWL